MDRVRIGFVGVGGMGQCAHLRNFASLPECEVVAIAELRQGLAKRVAEKYGSAKIYKDHKEMLANEKLDGIVAPQQFSRHGILIPELLEAKIPVMTEKPLSSSIEWGEKIVKALDASGTWYMVGYHKRSDPATMYAKAEIEKFQKSNELGKMKYVRILMPAGDWIANGFYDMIGSDEVVEPMEWETPPSDMDDATREQYISFVNYYIHQVNMMRHLLGEDYTVTYADKSGVLLAVESDSGVAGVIEMSPYQTTIDWQESMFVAFEHGYVKVELPAPVSINKPGRVEILKDPGDGVTPLTIVPSLPMVSAMRQQATNFCAAVRGDIKPMCEAKDALKDLRSAREYIKLFAGK